METGPKKARPKPPVKQKPDGPKTRLYLTEFEVNKLIAAAKSVGRLGNRDSTMILLAFRHGMRCTEIVNLQWDQIQLDIAAIEMRRAKRGTPAMHELTRLEIRALKKLAQGRRYRWVFTTEDGGMLGERSFHAIVQRAGKLAKLPFPVHPHMLRHACGYYLAAKGLDTRRIQDYLGHVKIQHTVLYTQLAPGRFAGFFED
jgi:type 1 fimbriae regulatory protein FimB/type 1 fimbriae regulatory protein FimE